MGYVSEREKKNHYYGQKALDTLLYCEGESEICPFRQIYETILWETELPLLSFIPHCAVACSTPESCCTSTDRDSSVCQGWDCQHERAGVLETEIDKVWEKYQHSNASLPDDPLWDPFAGFILIFRGGKPSLSIIYSENTWNMRTGSSWSDNTGVSKY